MKIKKENAIRLFQALGFKTASKWDSAKLKIKLNNLPDLVEEGFELEDEKMNIRLGKVLCAIEAGNKIVVLSKDDNSENEPEIERNEMAKKSTKKSKKKVVAKKKWEETKKETGKKPEKKKVKKEAKKKVG